MKDARARTGRRRIATVGAVCVALVSGACADLNRIDVDTCGNSVVEAGEDCDGAAGAGLTCGDPASAHACRYVCPDDGACPDGWSCSLDGVCAYAGGYQLAGDYPLPEDGLFALVVEDVDADEYGDLVWVTSTALQTRFGASADPLTDERTTVLPGIAGRPSLRDFDGDQRLDVVAPVLRGLHVLRGGPNRTIAPRIPLAPLPPLPDGQDEAVLHQPIRVGADPRVARQPTFVTVGVVSATLHIGEGTPTVYARTAVAHAVVADTDGLGGEELVTRATDGTVHIYEVTAEGGDRYTFSLRSSVNAPNVTDEWVAVHDVNSDGFADVLLFTSPPHRTYPSPVANVLVALNDGAGNFTDPVADPRFDDLLVEPPGMLRFHPNPAPLASADFDGDGHSDYVTENGVYAGHPTEPFTPIYLRASAATWANVELLDFNRDGRLDFATLTEMCINRPTVGFACRPLPRIASDLAAGDFDGDAIDDLAMIGSSLLPIPEASLSLIFGNTNADTSQEMTIGIVPPALISAIEIHDGPGGGPDGFADLRVNTFSGRVGVLYGSPLRAMYSPVTTPGIEVHATATVRTGGDGAVKELIALGVDLETGEPSLTSLPLAGAGAFSIGSIHTVPDVLEGQYDLTRTWSHAVADLDGDGGEELLIVGYEQPVGAVLHVLDFEASTASPPVINSTVTGRDQLVFQLHVADVDGDGAPDAIVTLSTDGFTPGDSGPAEVRVYWNTNGIFPSASYVSLPAVDQVGRRLLGAVAVQADEDPALEIAVATDTGITICELEGRAAIGCTRVAETTPEEQLLPETLRGGMRVGDINGDRLDDIIAWDNQTLRVFTAIPTTPATAAPAATR